MRQNGKKPGSSFHCEVPGRVAGSRGRGGRHSSVHPRPRNVSRHRVETIPLPCVLIPLLDTSFHPSLYHPIVYTASSSQPAQLVRAPLSRAISTVSRVSDRGHLIFPPCRCRGSRAAVSFSAIWRNCDPPFNRKIVEKSSFRSFFFANKEYLLEE